MFILFIIALVVSYTSIYAKIVLKRTLIGQKFLIDRSRDKQLLSAINYACFIAIFLCGFSMGIFAPFIATIISGLLVGILYGKFSELIMSNLILLDISAIVLLIILFFNIF